MAPRRVVPDGQCQMGERRAVPPSRRGCSATILEPADAGFSSSSRASRTTVPNIRQQEKRVRIAARQRLENLRYRSTIKTLAKRLETAVADGDCRGDRVGARRARADDRQGSISRRDPSKRGCPEEVAGRARRRRQLLTACSSRRGPIPRPFAAEIEQRSLQLQVGSEPRATLERQVELGKPDDRRPSSSPENSSDCL